MVSPISRFLMLPILYFAPRLCPQMPTLPSHPEVELYWYSGGQHPQRPYHSPRSAPSLHSRKEERRESSDPYNPRCRRSCRICAVQLLYRDARSCQEEIVSLSKQLFRRFSPMRCGMVEEIYDFSDHTAPSQKPKFSLGGLLE